MDRQSSVACPIGCRAARRTTTTSTCVASIGDRHGPSLPVIGALLGHKTPRRPRGTRILRLVRCVPRTMLSVQESQRQWDYVHPLRCREPTEERQNWLASVMDLLRSTFKQRLCALSGRARGSQYCGSFPSSWRGHPRGRKQRRRIVSHLAPSTPHYQEFFWNQRDIVSTRPKSLH